MQKIDPGNRREKEAVVQLRRNELKILVLRSANNSLKTPVQNNDRGGVGEQQRKKDIKVEEFLQKHKGDWLDQ